MAKRYREEVSKLVASLNDNSRKTEAASILRGLIEQVKLTPDAEGERLVVDVVGDLAGLLLIATNDNKPLVNKGLLALTSGLSEALVAGAGFEPATFRL